MESLPQSKYRNGEELIESSHGHVMQGYHRAATHPLKMDQINDIQAPLQARQVAVALQPGSHPTGRQTCFVVFDPCLNVALTCAAPYMYFLPPRLKPMIRAKSLQELIAEAYARRRTNKMLHADHCLCLESTSPSRPIVDSFST